MRYLQIIKVHRNVRLLIAGIDIQIAPDGAEQYLEYSNMQFPIVPIRWQTNRNG